MRQLYNTLVRTVRVSQGGVLRGLQEESVRGEDPVVDRGNVRGAVVEYPGERGGLRPNRGGNNQNSWSVF